jgi:hypothetical protein
MYAQDYDETIIPWFVRTSLPRDEWRHDIVSWVQNLQPYIKNGTPVDPPSGYAGPVDPIGMMKCPSFKPADFLKQADMPDCDGPGALDQWIPAKWYHANYGIGFGATGGSCTNVDPYQHFAGSDVRTHVMTLSEVQRVAESVEVGDGFTGIINNGANSFGTTLGCESADSHTGGGNQIFVDSHAKWIARNVERYLDTDPAGCVYKKYFTVDK